MAGTTTGSSLGSATAVAVATAVTTGFNVGVGLGDGFAVGVRVGVATAPEFCSGVGVLPTTAAFVGDAGAAVPERTSGFAARDVLAGFVGFGTTSIFVAVTLSAAGSRPVIRTIVPVSNGGTRDSSVSNVLLAGAAESTRIVLPSNRTSSVYSSEAMTSASNENSGAGVGA